MPSKGNKFLTNVLQAITIFLATAILGALGKTYLDVHDLKIAVQDQKGKIDWLYKYNFPKMGEGEDGR
jgi:hypothetical protein